MSSIRYFTAWDHSVEVIFWMETIILMIELMIFFQTKSQIVYVDLVQYHQVDLIWFLLLFSLIPTLASHQATQMIWCLKNYSLISLDLMIESLRDLSEFASFLINTISQMSSEKLITTTYYCLRSHLEYLQDEITLWHCHHYHWRKTDSNYFQKIAITIIQQSQTVFKELKWNTKCYYCSKELKLFFCQSIGLKSLIVSCQIYQIRKISQEAHLNEKNGLDQCILQWKQYPFSFISY